MKAVTRGLVISILNHNLHNVKLLCAFMAKMQALHIPTNFLATFAHMPYSGAAEIRQGFYNVYDAHIFRIYITILIQNFWFEINIPPWMRLQLDILRY